MSFLKLNNQKRRRLNKAKSLDSKNVILELLDVDKLKAEANEWTMTEMTAIQARVSELYRFLETHQATGWTAKQQEETKSRTPKKSKVVTHINQSSIPVEALRQVSMSGFLSAEDLGRFLLRTCKDFSESLTENFISEVLLSSPFSESLNHVPRQILQARGPQWLYDEIIDGVAVSLMDQPTTLSVDNLTISLKIFHGKVEIYSHMLAGADLTNFLEDGFVAIELFQDSHERLFEEDATDLSATMHGFREDTNQVVQLLDCDCILTEGLNVLFQGQNFGFLCMEVRITFDDADCDAIMTVRNVYDPKYNNSNDESDSNFDFFRALHHFTPWKG